MLRSVKLCVLRHEQESLDGLRHPMHGITMAWTTHHVGYCVWSALNVCSCLALFMPFNVPEPRVYHSCCSIQCMKIRPIKCAFPTYTLSGVELAWCSPHTWLAATKNSVYSSYIIPLPYVVLKPRKEVYISNFRSRTRDNAAARNLLTHIYSFQHAGNIHARVYTV